MKEYALLKKQSTRVDFDTSKYEKYMKKKNDKGLTGIYQSFKHTTEM